MIEYSVRPVTRYFVTRYHSDGSEGGVDTKGEYENYNTAHEVAYALCKAEHAAAGTPLDDINFVYPKDERMVAVSTSAPTGLSRGLG